jgi:hypothetical protein
LTKTKDEQFHTIQARQAEAETARAETELLENRTRELEFQLREANERIAVLEDASTSSAPRGQDRGRVNGFFDGERFNSSPSPSPSRSRQNSGPSPADMQRIVAEAEARGEAKLVELRGRVRSLERERNELEEEWGSKVHERVREAEGLKRRIQEMQAETDEGVESVRRADERVVQEGVVRKGLEKEIQGLKAQLEEKSEDVATAQEGEVGCGDVLGRGAVLMGRELPGMSWRRSSCSCRRLTRSSRIKRRSWGICAPPTRRCARSCARCSRACS